MSAAWVLPSIVGPLLAASISAVWSWRGVFLLVVPAVAATLAALIRAGESDVDLDPLIHAADAFLRGARRTVEAFTD